MPAFHLQNLQTVVNTVTAAALSISCFSTYTTGAGINPFQLATDNGQHSCCFGCKCMHIEMQIMQ